MKTLSIIRIFFIVLSLMTASAFAVEPFDYGSCATALTVGRIEQVQGFRIANYNKVLQYKDQVRRMKDTIVQFFFTSLESRTTANGHHAADKMLAKLGIVPVGNHDFGIPIVSQEALGLLQEAYEPTQPLEGFGYRGHIWDAAFNAFEKDPYFQWLKTRAADNRRMKVDPNRLQVEETEGGLELGFAPQPTDPIELLKSTIYISRRGALPPKIAVIRVMRDLDPELTPDQLAIADMAIKAYLLEHSIEYGPEEIFNPSTAMDSRNHARRLAPSLKTAQVNLRKILEHQIKLFGRMVPRHSYERLIALIEADKFPKVVYDINTFKMANNDRELSEEQLAPYKKRLQQLALDLGLSPDIPLAQIPELVSTPGRNTSITSYPHFLIYAFQNDSNVWSIVLSLQEIIEAGEAIQSEETFLASLKELRQRFGTRF